MTDEELEAIEVIGSNRERALVAEIRRQRLELGRLQNLIGRVIEAPKRFRKSWHSKGMDCLVSMLRLERGPMIRETSGDPDGPKPVRSAKGPVMGVKVDRVAVMAELGDPATWATDAARLQRQACSPPSAGQDSEQDTETNSGKEAASTQTTP